MSSVLSYFSNCSIHDLKKNNENRKKWFLAIYNSPQYIVLVAGVGVAAVQGAVGRGINISWWCILGSVFAAGNMS